MKGRILYPLVLNMVCAVYTIAQVGINTGSPKATLDVASTPLNLSSVDGIIVPKLTGAQLVAKEGNYTDKQTGAILYITEALAATATTTATANVNTVGFYYFDGSVWQKINDTTTNYLSAIDIGSGLSKDGKSLCLGGELKEPTTITTSASSPLKIAGLESSVSQDEFMVVGIDGTLKRKTISSAKGVLATTYNIQGTDPLTINQGTRADVPGLTFTHVVPGNVISQTLVFTVTGYMVRAGDFRGGGQGAFELYQNNVKISSAYASVASGINPIKASDNLFNLPVPATIQKSVTLTPGSYTFKIAYSSWAENAIVNYNPLTYVGYNQDNESMLTKMSVLVYNN